MDAPYGGFLPSVGSSLTVRGSVIGWRRYATRGVKRCAGELSVAGVS